MLWRGILPPLFVCARSVSLPSSAGLAEGRRRSGSAVLLLLQYSTPLGDQRRAGGSLCGMGLGPVGWVVERGLHSKALYSKKIFLTCNTPTRIPAAGNMAPRLPRLHAYELSAPGQHGYTATPLHDGFQREIVNNAREARGENFSILHIHHTDFKRKF